MKSIWKYNIFFLGEGVVVFHLQVKYTVCKMIINHVTTVLVLAGL